MMSDDDTSSFAWSADSEDGQDNCSTSEMSPKHIMNEKDQIKDENHTLDTDYLSDNKDNIKVKKKLKKSKKKVKEHKETESDHEQRVDVNRDLSPPPAAAVKSDHSDDGDSKSAMNGFTVNHLTVPKKSHLDKLLNGHSKSRHSLPDKLNKRTVRISDRLTFEDSPNFKLDQDLPSDNYAPTERLINFIEADPRLKPVKSQLEEGTVISENDDLWLLKCPTEIDIQSLKNVEINLEAKCKIKINSLTYEGAPCVGSTRLAVLSRKGSRYLIRNLPLEGALCFRKRIPKAHYQEDNVMVNNQTSFIPLPETKHRHPLFGTNYKKAIKIPSKVAQRLHPLAHDSEPEPRKKKKRKREKSECASPAEEAPRAKRRRVLAADTAEAWGSERAIEQNLFNF